ncbi:MAG: maleylpyruvate isomerase N-terminal domain-containing protein [Gemmatimonadota bacterium]
MECRDSGESVAIWTPDPALAAYHAGVTVICELAARFPEEAWAAATPCPEWRVADLAGHLRCVADDYHEYLDDAPASRLARLMATGAEAGSLARKLARQNAAELAALPDGSGLEHVRAFSVSAREYAQRVQPLWHLPHHHYRDQVVTVGGMVGAACAEWHLHAWDLARAIGKDYRPADPGILVAGWQAGLPHLPLDLPAAHAVAMRRPAAGVLARCAAGPDSGRAGGGSVILGAGGPDSSPAWTALLRASGRLP